MPIEQDSYINEVPTAAALDGSEQVLMFQGSGTVQNALSVIQAYFKTLGYLPRTTQVATGGATPTPDATTTDVYVVTTQNANMNWGAPAGIAVNGQRLILRIKDDGTPRTFTFNAAYNFSTSLTAPATTTANKWIYLEFIYNDTTTKWDCVLKIDNF